MKSVVLFLLCLTASAAVFSQPDSTLRNECQIGMFNKASSQKGFTFSKHFDVLCIQVTNVTGFAKQFKVLSSLGVSGQLTFNTANYGEFFTYTGVQRIQTKLNDRHNYINLGVGIGFKTKVNEAVEFVCQGGSNTLNAFKTTRNTVVNSEIGIYYHF